MNFRILLIQLLMLSLFSCTNKDANEKIVFEGEELWLKNYFYSDGSLKGQQTFLEIKTDSFVSHGFSKYFYPSGSLEYFTRLDYGNKIGTVYKYFETSKVKEVWFYNPVGEAIYSREYNENGEVINEHNKEKRTPQVVYKKNENNSVELKVYSVNIPERKKNVYLINGDLEVIDSVLNSKSPYDLFVFDQRHKEYQINTDYYDKNLEAYIETDNLQFSIEE